MTGTLRSILRICFATVVVARAEARVLAPLGGPRQRRAGHFCQRPARKSARRCGPNPNQRAIAVRRARGR